MFFNLNSTPQVVVIGIVRGYLIDDDVSYDFLAVIYIQTSPNSGFLSWLANQMHIFKWLFPCACQKTVVDDAHFIWEAIQSFQNIDYYLFLL